MGFLGGFLKPFGSIFGSICVVLAVIGGPLVAYWDRRPPDTPRFHVWGPITIHFPESLKAKLDAERQREVAAAQHAQQVKVRVETITKTVVEKAQAQEARTRIVYRDIAKEIPDVLTPDVVRRYALPVGFVRLHDASALGLSLSSIPDPAGLVDADPSDVTVDQAASAISDNYGSCRITRDRYVALQEWVKQVEAAQ